MSDLDNALAEFHRDLDRTDNLLELVKSFRSFAASTVPLPVADTQVPWPETVELHASAHGVRTDLPVVAGSLLLYLCGRFEFFVREVVIAVAEEMAAKAVLFSDLPETVQNELKFRTLEVAGAPARFGIAVSDAEQMLITLAANLDSKTSGAVVISSTVLAITDANMNPRVLADVMKRVSIANVWSDAGKQAKLKTNLQQTTDGACTAEATARLEALMKERNKIAHPTNATTFPDPDQVIEYSAFLRILSEVLVDLAKIPR